METGKYTLDLIHQSTREFMRNRHFTELILNTASTPVKARTLGEVKELQDIIWQTKHEAPHYKQNPLWHTIIEGITTFEIIETCKINVSWKWIIWLRHWCYLLITETWYMFWKCLLISPGGSDMSNKPIIAQSKSAKLWRMAIVFRIFIRNKFKTMKLCRWSLCL